jgi:acetylornithine/succinyldiaminopimelate/putrescine aminotransferase
MTAGGAEANNLACIEARSTRTQEAIRDRPEFIAFVNSLPK